MSAKPKIRVTAQDLQRAEIERAGRQRAAELRRESPMPPAEAERIASALRPFAQETSGGEETVPAA
jgi:hypothetical protein